MARLACPEQSRRGSPEFTEGRRAHHERFFLDFFSIYGVSSARLDSKVPDFKQSITAALLLAIGNNTPVRQNATLENEYISIYIPMLLFLLYFIQPVFSQPNIERK